MRYLKHLNVISLTIILFIMPLSGINLLHAQNNENKLKIEKCKRRISNGEDSLYIELGELYLENEQWNKADNAFKFYLKNVKEIPRAYTGRGRSLLGKGTSAFIPVEAIKKLFHLDNFSRASGEFKKALKLDSEYIDAYYWSALNNLAKGGDSNYRKAIASCQEVLKRNVNYKDTDYVLGVSYQHLCQWEKAIEILEGVIAKDRFIAKSMIRLSDICIEYNKPERAIEYFYNGIKRLKDPEILEDLYAQIKILLSKNDKKLYKVLPLEEKGRFFWKFWKSKDPTPTTLKNERYEVHYKRVKQALVIYRDIIPPYFDDRGKIYVKYGEPDDKYVSRSNSQLPEGVRHNESWTYERTIEPGLTFDFVSRGNVFREVITLQDAAPARFSPAEARALAMQLYAERMALSDSYMNVMAHANGLLDFQSKRYEAQMKAPSENFRYELPGKRIEFYYSAARFNDEDTKTRVEFYFAIPLNQITCSQLPDKSVGTIITYNMIIQDSSYNTIINRMGSIPVAGNSLEELKTRHLLHQEDFVLTPGQYRFAVHLKNSNGDEQQSYSNPLIIDKHNGNKLNLSDIQLSSKIEPLENGSIFCKNNLQVIPYPYRIINNKKPIYIYFEGYDLTLDALGQNDYTLTYTLKMLKTKRGILSSTFGAIGRLFKGASKGEISSSFHRKGTNVNIVEYLSLDLGKLKAGDVELKLTLNDNHIGKSSVNSIMFQLIQDNN
ncbi:GWxTD domain-containing protein [bacterium]|nr:GWxTD domain-containing protein [bacterium]